jgi:hypothetical protein
MNMVLAMTGEGVECHIFLRIVLLRNLNSLIGSSPEMTQPLQIAEILERDNTIWSFLISIAPCLYGFLLFDHYWHVFMKTTTCHTYDRLDMYHTKPVRIEIVKPIPAPSRLVAVS